MSDYPNFDSLDGLVLVLEDGAEEGGEWDSDAYLTAATTVRMAIGELTTLRERVVELECQLEAVRIDLSFLDDGIQEEHEAAESAALEEVARLEGENQRLSDIYGDPDAERISVPKIIWSGLQRWKDQHKCCPSNTEEVAKLRELLEECLFYVDGARGRPWPEFVKAEDLGRRIRKKMATLKEVKL